MRMNCYKGGMSMDQIHIHARRGKTYWYFDKYIYDHIYFQALQITTSSYNLLLLTLWLQFPSVTHISLSFSFCFFSLLSDLCLYVSLLKISATKIQKQQKCEINP
jgi:hypothetical protein